MPKARRPRKVFGPADPSEVVTRPNPIRARRLARRPTPPPRPVDDTRATLEFVPLKRAGEHEALFDRLLPPPVPPDHGSFVPDGPLLAVPSASHRSVTLRIPVPGGRTSHNWMLLFGIFVALGAAGVVLGFSLLQG